MAAGQNQGPSAPFPVTVACGRRAVTTPGHVLRMKPTQLSSTHLPRRLVLGGLAGGLAAPALLVRAQAQGVPFIHHPFPLGVAAGDPDERGFVIWTRLAHRRRLRRPGRAREASRGAGAQPTGEARARRTQRRDDDRAPRRLATRTSASSTPCARPVGPAVRRQCWDGVERMTAARHPTAKRYHQLRGIGVDRRLRPDCVLRPTGIGLQQSLSAPCTWCREAQSQQQCITAARAVPAPDAGRGG